MAIVILIVVIRHLYFKYLCAINYQTMKKPFHYKKLLQYFLQGLLILAPITITAYAIFWVVSSIDSLLPIFTYKDLQGNVKVQNYGIGFLIIIAALVVIGYFSSFFITGRVVSFVDKLLEKTPGIKYIYSTTRDFFEAFAGNKKKFSQAVLANVFADDVWIVGFLTDEEMEKFDMGAEKVGVYVPQAYNFAGQLYILPRDKVRKIDKITSGEAMKYAVTGGVVDLDAEKTEQSHH